MNGLLRLCAIVCALSLTAVGAYAEQCSACGLSVARGNGASAKLPNGTVDNDFGDGGYAGTGSAGPVAEGRGKKKKKMKDATMNMMVGGSVMAAFVVISTFLNTITVTLVKAFLFTFIAKFLVFVNWISSGPSSEKKSSRKDVTVVLE